MIDVPTFPMPDAYSRLCAALVPASYGASRQWYRRAIGGQWSLSLLGRWRTVKACPAPFHTAILGGEPVPVGVCHEWDDGTPRGAEECHCETWPVPAPWHPSPRVAVMMDVIVRLFA